MIQYKLVPTNRQQELTGADSLDETRSAAIDEQADYGIVDLNSINVDDILMTIPRELVHKCKAILAYLINAKVQVQRDGYRMVYDGGVIGSPLQDLLRWTVSGDRGEERPWDQMRFFRTLTELKVVRSIFGQG